MIEDVRVFDWEFGFLCNLNRFNSLNWQLFFNDVGNFEGHFAKDSKLVDLVMRNRYLLLVQGDKQAIVTGYLAGDDFAVYGRTVNWLLTRRVSPVLATETTVTVETYTRGLVADAFSNVSNFALGAVAGYTNPYPFQREKMENLCSVVTAALEMDRAGHEMAFDFSTKQIVYRCVKGVTRPNLVCAAYNAYDMGGSYDMLDFMTSGWYEKSVEGGDPVWTKISGAETGIYLSIGCAELQEVANA